MRTSRSSSANLLIWGLSMSIVGAIICSLFFGILGI